ncbi:ABC transporter permease [Streptomyces griseorubiginosus]
MRPRHGRGGRRRVRGRGLGRGHLPGPGRHLGVPGVPAGHLPFGGAAHQRPEARPTHRRRRSLWLPVAIIAAIYVPYIARPLRGQVLVLRNKEYIQAAVGSGAPTPRILRREVLPNVVPTALVFVPLMTALAMLTESALSFLSVGVQPPDASWGTIIEDGLGLLYTRPAVTIAPGLLIALTTAALNVLGDGVRDALDPGARLRGGV